MQIHIDSKHDPAIQKALTQDGYATADELIDDLLTTYEIEQWARDHRDEVMQLVEQGEQTPIVDLSLSELRDRLTKTIRRSAS